MEFKPKIAVQEPFTLWCWVDQALLLFLSVYIAHAVGHAAPSTAG